ncbi:MAG: EVE domain-containing protein [Pseudomonadota bacterium]
MRETTPIDNVAFKRKDSIATLVTRYMDEIKATPMLADMVLVNNSRLSVQPVTASEWKAVCALAGLKKPPTA